MTAPLKPNESPDGLAGQSLGAAPCSARAGFEKWISGPPYERDLYRWPMDETKHAWPDQYKDLAVQLSWEAWQESPNAALTDPAAKPKETL
jgi:hypothetical protein